MKMEQIELVVKISRYAFDEIKKHDSVLNVYLSHVECMHDAIKNGTPLPKGHGALKDADALLSKAKLLYKGYEIALTNIIGDAPTIIEADKEGAEK